MPPRRLDCGGLEVETAGAGVRRFLIRGTAAPAVLGVLTLALLVVAIQERSALSTWPAPATATRTASVAFIGDGYTSGSPDGGEGPANHTALLAARDRWRVTNPSVYGSGYVAGAPKKGRLATVAEARPQLVVVTGGRADTGPDAPAVQDAAERLFRDLRARLPETRIVVIGPVWIGGEAPRTMRDVRDAIRDSATAAQLPFVDPIEQRWFIDRDRDGLTPDGENLTDRGHQRLTELVEQALRENNTLPR